MIILSLISFLVIGLIGGGVSILGVRLLVYIMGYSAVEGTSYLLFIVGVNSLIGAIAYLKKGEISCEGSIGHQKIDWSFLLIVSVSCAVGILLGSLFSNKVSQQKLKPAFGWLTLAVGFFVLIE